VDEWDVLSLRDLKNPFFVTTFFAIVLVQTSAKITNRHADNIVFCRVVSGRLAKDKLPDPVLIDFVSITVNECINAKSKNLQHSRSPSEGATRDKTVKRGPCLL
jgi:hypothetical protein